MKTIPDHTYSTILSYMNLVFPALNLRAYTNVNGSFDSVPLPLRANYFDYAVIDGRRYHASSHSTTRKNSMLEAFVGMDGATCVGELIDIINVELNSGQQFTLGHFRWLHPAAELGLEMEDSYWPAL